MKGIRRKEKAIESEEEMISILEKSKYITIAMCEDNTPYLVTLSHGYDREGNCIFFHCAREGKKVDILTENSNIWGQAIIDHGYTEGACDHLYATTQFKGKVSFIEDMKEKEHALRIMINSLEPNPELVLEEQITEKSVQRVHIGRIDIEFMSGKKSKEVIIQL
ncbi:MAG: pyridoxamine 5'-phosphate oxidase family protein [Candidatus Thorarchaeota archaeon]|nr:pyridoxamine 5'-phosphate oxidase family protein [Candidatus Thorarchaeota archaeon]